MTNLKTLSVDSATATAMRIVLDASEPPAGQDQYRWDRAPRADWQPEPPRRATTAG